MWAFSGIFLISWFTEAFLQYSGEKIIETLILVELWVVVPWSVSPKVPRVTLDISYQEQVKKTCSCVIKLQFQLNVNQCGRARQGSAEALSSGDPRTRVPLK